VDVEPDCGDDPRSLPQSAERTRFCTAAAVSLCLAMTAAIAGGVAASYIYELANSKGDDLAVITGGLLAIGTFVFVILFPWLRTLHHKTSWRTPWLAWLVCLAGSVLITALLWPAGDLDHSMIFIRVDWIAILSFGLVAVVLSRRCLVDKLE
jgi:hypothetical protein